MLIKIGDVWVDPTEVASVRPWRETRVAAVDHTEGGKVDVTVGETGVHGCEVQTRHNNYHYVEDVTADEAARLINRALEAHKPPADRL